MFIMTKLLKLSFAFSLLILVFSCGKDDDPVAAKGDLEGDWTATAFNATIETSSAGVQLSTLKLTGTSFDYDLNLDGSNFTTSGGYSATQEVISAGVNQTTDVDYANINGTGTYTTDGNMMTVNGAFFELQANGIPGTAGGETQNATYEINADGELIFNQDETVTETSNGFTVDAKIVSTSTWVRK